jgi:hypothetical protein
VNRYYPIIRAACFVVFSIHPPQGPDREVQCINWTDFNSWSTMVNIATVEGTFLPPHFIAISDVSCYSSTHDVTHMGPLREIPCSWPYPASLLALHRCNSSRNSQVWTSGTPLPLHSCKSI